MKVTGSSQAAHRDSRRESQRAAKRLLPCHFPCKDEVREGSVQSNHPELMRKNSIHLAISAMMWFEKVRGGSIRLNHPELVHKHPAHLVSPVKM